MFKTMKINRKNVLKQSANCAGAAGLLLLSASCVPNAGIPQLTVSADALATERLASAALPVLPEPSALRPVTPEAAVALNAAIPVVQDENIAARPFPAERSSIIDRMRAVDCLTSAIFYEAASESDEGQRAVAQVVLNRVRHPTFPNSVCGVVYQGSERSSGCQFSFTCDGSLLRTPSLSGWARARRLAAAALAGSVYAPVGHATHYHTDQVLPYWASSLVKSAVIGAHIFYRWNGSWGAPAAFRAVYAGGEPLPGPKPSASAGLLPPIPLKVDRKALLSIGELQPVSAAYAPVTASAAPAAPAEVEVARAGPKLPESTILDKHRFTGIPRDELPAAIAAAAK
jgi:spore germination cell wall hydrolase CwlJ-like protein